MNIIYLPPVSLDHIFDSSRSCLISLFPVMKISALTGLLVLLALGDSASAKNDKEKKKKGGLAEASFVLVGDSTTNNNTVTPNCRYLRVLSRNCLVHLITQLEVGVMASAPHCSPA